MSRMRLYLDRPRQPDDNEVATYPIYELDLQGLSDAGMVSWGLRGQVINAASECYYLSGGVNNANVNRYLSTNIPHQQWQDGSILQARISKYFLNENNVYVPDPEYYDFEEIPIGQQPDDWGTASNYMKYQVLSNATIGGRTVTYRAYYNVLQTATWDASAQYVRDKNRKMIRLFYTDNGYSFGVYQGADSEGGSDTGPVFNVAGYSQYSYDGSNPYESRYIWRNSGGARLRVGGNIISFQSACYSRGLPPSIVGDVLAGNNSVARSYYIFVHAVYNDKDYYGTLYIYPNDQTEFATFNQINFALYTGEFWGKSITTGGYDGKWGDDSIAAGGNGSFDFTTTDDASPQQFEDDYIRGRSALDTVLQAPWSPNGGSFSIHALAPIELPLIMDKLYNTSFIGMYANSMFNPMSGVLSLALLPSGLVGDDTVKSKLSISGYNVSDAIDHSDPFLFQEVRGIGRFAFDPVSIDSVFDGFPDFAPYTTAELHLPYIGDLEIDINLIAHGTLKVYYQCDNLSGNVCAWVLCEDHEGHHKYLTATGNCAYNIPLCSTFFDGSAMGKLIGSSIQTATSGLLSEMHPKYAIPHQASMAHGLGQAISSTFDVIHAPRGTTIRGEFGGNAGIVTNTLCYLVITRPAWIQPKYYSELNGIPSELSGTLFDDMTDDHTTYNGYTVVSEIHLENVDCTENEKAMIEAALKRGVHIYSERY